METIVIEAGPNILCVECIMRCVVYDVLLQCCFITSTSLLSNNHLLWIYWCVIKVVYASLLSFVMVCCEVCCLCCSSIECKQHISFNTFVFNIAHLCAIPWLAIIKDTVRI